MENLVKELKKRIKLLVEVVCVLIALSIVILWLCVG